MLPLKHTHILIEGGGKEGVEEKGGVERERTWVGENRRIKMRTHRYLSVLTLNDLLIESILFLILVIS